MGKSDQHDVAATIRHAVALLASEARRVKLDTLAYLLDLAVIEACQHAHDDKDQR